MRNAFIDRLAINYDNVEAIQLCFPTGEISTCAAAALLVTAYSGRTYQVDFNTKEEASEEFDKWMKKLEKGVKKTKKSKKK